VTLDELLACLPPGPAPEPAFPRHLLGAFRRKSITFCTGLTDEVTPVYWFQSRRFTLDLRLPGLDETAVEERQGWIGDTLWDEGRAEMAWSVGQSYQTRNQWPEPARLAFIGNSVLEFAPSGAYVEDWRQLASHGPLLGLRLVSLQARDSGTVHAMDGGLIVAGAHVALARCRLPADEAAVHDGTARADQIESYEVSVALDGSAVTHSTQPARRGQPIAPGPFAVLQDGSVTQETPLGTLRYTLDTFAPEFAFATQTPTTPQALAWLEAERDHLARHARVVG
jgi:hypothetical protein